MQKKCIELFVLQYFLVRKREIKTIVYRHFRLFVSRNYSRYQKYLNTRTPSVYSYGKIGNFEVEFLAHYSWHFDANFFGNTICHEESTDFFSDFFLHGKSLKLDDVQLFERQSFPVEMG